MTNTNRQTMAHDLAIKARGLSTPVEEKRMADAFEKDVIESLSGTQELAVKAANGLALPSDVADFYKENAKLGTENLAGNVPVLSIVQPNSKGLLADERRPDLGYYFYKPNQTQYSMLEANMVLVSRGFYDKPYQAKEGEVKKPVFTQILAGMTKDDMPFLMFFKGKSLQSLWDFTKVVNQYAFGARPIPMMGLNVVMTSHKEKTNFGDVYVPDFEIAKKDGKLDLVMDMNRLNQLSEYYHYATSMIDSLIQTKTGEATPAIEA